MVAKHPSTHRMLCTAHQRQRERREFEQSISNRNNNNDCWWWDWVNCSTDTCSNLVDFTVILPFFCDNFFVIVNSRVRTGEINAMRLLFNCESFFCPELLYFIKTLNSQNGHESIFYLHYCQFNHLIYLGTCRTFARTNHWNNLPLLWFESHLIESNYFACHSHQFKYCLFYELHVSTSIIHEKIHGHISN